MASKAHDAITWPVYQPRGWGAPSGARPLPRPWYGLDTERDAKTGRFVCGFAVGENVLRFESLYDLPPATYWVWNLAYDIEGLLRDTRDETAWAARADGAAFALRDGVACYYHGKRFDWKNSDGKRNFLEASSFFGRVPLSKIGPKRRDVDASLMSLTRYRADAEYRAEVDAYCIQDARIVYDAICDLDMGVRAVGVDLGATPGATARRFLGRLPQFPALIWQTHKAFLRSYCGGRFEVTKRGWVPDVYQYDIVSAYPWALSNCPWLTDDSYMRQSRRYSDTAIYGSYLVSFDYDDYLGVAPRWRGPIRVYSKRESKTWLTRPEVDFLLRRGAHVTIHRAVEIFDENAGSLWRDVITELFDVKRRGGKKPEGLGAKIILNSQYGVLIQLVRRSGQWVRAVDAVNPVDFAGTLALEEPPREFEGGKYFAPVYAGHLTALTRVKLLEAAESLGREAYIGGHTDSVLTMKPLRTGLGEALGDWKLEKQADHAEVCKTGMYAIGDVVKIRGITRKGSPAMLWQETFNRKSRIGIKSAARWDDVSVIVPKTVANNYAAEQKRVWFGDVTRGLIAMRRFVDSEALVEVGK